jgi:aldehyde:ferredoxin oxidoreductase
VSKHSTNHFIDYILAEYYVLKHVPPHADPLGPDNGRSGMGTVMGSKKLKAIVVRGKTKYLDLAHDSQSLQKVGQLLPKRVKEHPQSWNLQNRGTSGLVGGLNATGMLPTRNFRQGAFESVDKVAW